MRRRNKPGGNAAKRPGRKTSTRVNSRRGSDSSPAIRDAEIAKLTLELHEAVEQQKATSEILNVISRTTFDLPTVLDMLTASACRLCDANIGSMRYEEGDGYQLAATYGFLPEWRKNVERYSNKPDLTSIFGQTIIKGRTVHIPDLLLDPYYARPETQKLMNVRAALGIPLVRNGHVFGAIVIYRQEVRPFTDKQIELVRNFAAQSVIAIENTRLLNELRQRTDDLSEALEQQTATSEVLKVISSSPGELQPVFQAMLENATHLCEAHFGAIVGFDGELFHPISELNTPARLSEFLRQRGSFTPQPGSVLEQVIQTKAVVQIEDDAARPTPGAPAKFGGARSTLGVPMLKDDKLVGAFVIYRTEVRPFTDKQMELVSNFAAQAVIAIENTRLLDELNKLNQQLEQRVADQVGEIERMGKLRRFLPPQVADLIVASGAEKQLESHRREITALFCDLRGFTGFSESADPEDVMALLREYHAAIGAIINKYGGTLERYAGDGVMVVFNDPIPVDNPALQAVLMAIDMRAAIGHLIEKWRKLGHDIGFGIGIAHGYATLGTVGFEGRFDYAAIGTVSNVASRLCDEAKPGQILISPRVLMAVEKDIAVEPVGDFALKGISRPVAAYNVLSAVPPKLDG